MVESLGLNVGDEIQIKAKAPEELAVARDLRWQRAVAAQSRRRDHLAAKGSPPFRWQALGANGR